MMAGSLHVLLCVGIAVVGFANLMHMSGMATPNWMAEVYHAPLPHISQGQAAGSGSYDDRDSYYDSRRRKRYAGRYGGSDETKDGDVLSFQGLFEKCTNKQYYEDQCEDIWFYGRYTSMKQQVLQVLAFLALASGLIGAGSAIVLQAVMFVSKKTVSCILVIVTTTITTTCCIAASGFILSILGLYGDRFLVKKDMQLSYSFFLCLIAMAAHVVGTAIILIASRSINATIANNTNTQPQGNGRVNNTASYSTGHESVTLNEQLVHESG